MMELNHETLSALLESCAKNYFYSGLICCADGYGKELFLKTMTEHLREIPEIERITRASGFIEFINGSKIKVISASSDSIRGIRANRVLYDSQITDPFIRSALRQAETSQSSADTVNEFVRWIDNKLSKRPKDRFSTYVMGDWGEDFGEPDRFIFTTTEPEELNSSDDHELNDFLESFNIVSDF